MDAQAHWDIYAEKQLTAFGALSSWAVAVWLIGPLPPDPRKRSSELVSTLKVTVIRGPKFYLSNKSWQLIDLDL